MDHSEQMNESINFAKVSTWNLETKAGTIELYGCTLRPGWIREEGESCPLQLGYCAPPSPFFDCLFVWFFLCVCAFVPFV